MNQAGPKTSPGQSRVIVAGYYATGSGYPNGRVTQQQLQQAGYTVTDLGTAMPSGARLWKTARGSLAGKLGGAITMLGHNLRSAVRVLIHATRDDRVYVRYPGIPFMLLMSLVPSRWRPACYLEAFISLWDAAFVDRGSAARSRTVASRLVRALESRAMRAARVVIVDTDANARFAHEQLNVESDRVLALPLGVDEAQWEAAVGSPDGPFTVLFVGTFVPLHGTARIVEAIELLGSEAGLRFVFIGDGQDAPVLQRFIETHPHMDIQWRREWLPPDELAACVRQAHVCLGVFGGDGKASRVLPYKLYMYLCLGKAVVTQAPLSTPASVPSPPAEYVADASPAQLAQALRTLRADPQRRARLESEARAFYVAHLSNARLEAAWRHMLGQP